jgi:hypothetical protein
VWYANYLIKEAVGPGMLGRFFRRMWVRSPKPSPARITTHEMPMSEYNQLYAKRPGAVSQPTVSDIPSSNIEQLSRLSDDQMNAYIESIKRKHGPY